MVDGNLQEIRLNANSFRIISYNMLICIDIMLHTNM